LPAGESFQSIPFPSALFPSPPLPSPPRTRSSRRAGGRREYSRLPFVSSARSPRVPPRPGRGVDCHLEGIIRPPGERSPSPFLYGLPPGIGASSSSPALFTRPLSRAVLSLLLILILAAIRARFLPEKEETGAGRERGGRGGRLHRKPSAGFIIIRRDPTRGSCQFRASSLPKAPRRRQGRRCSAPTIRSADARPDPAGAGIGGGGGGGALNVTGSRVRGRTEQRMAWITSRSEDTSRPSFGLLYSNEGPFGPSSLAR